jgi:hypothetical protein
MQTDRGGDFRLWGTSDYEMIAGAVTSVEQMAAREKCSIRQVNMTISLAFLAPRNSPDSMRRMALPVFGCQTRTIPLSSLPKTSNNIIQQD